MVAYPTGMGNALGGDRPCGAGKPYRRISRICTGVMEFCIFFSYATLYCNFWLFILSDKTRFCQVDILADDKGEND